MSVPIQPDDIMDIIDDLWLLIGEQNRYVKDPTLDDEPFPYDEVFLFDDETQEAVGSDTQTLDTCEGATTEAGLPGLISDGNSALWESSTAPQELASNQTEELNLASASNDISGFEVGAATPGETDMEAAPILDTPFVLERSLSTDGLAIPDVMESYRPIVFDGNSTPPVDSAPGRTSTAFSNLIGGRKKAPLASSASGVMSASFVPSGIIGPSPAAASEQTSAVVPTPLIGQLTFGYPHQRGEIIPTLSSRSRRPRDLDLSGLSSHRPTPYSDGFSGFRARRSQRTQRPEPSRMGVTGGLFVPVDNMGNIMIQQGGQPVSRESTSGGTSTDRSLPEEQSAPGALPPTNRQNFSGEQRLAFLHGEFAYNNMGLGFDQNNFY